MVYLLFFSLTDAYSLKPPKNCNNESCLEFSGQSILRGYISTKHTSLYFGILKIFALLNESTACTQRVISASFT